MTMVLQVMDLLYIKYESQESIVMYISNHWVETTRERVCQYYWKKVGDVLYVHINPVSKKNPENIYGTRKLKPKIWLQNIHQRLVRQM